MILAAYMQQRNVVHMKKVKPENQNKYCASCGAPVVSEICAYCGTKTGLDTTAADMEYPVLECKEAIANFWTVGFPLIFAAAFGIPGFILLLIAGTGFGNGSLLLNLNFFFLLLVGFLHLLNKQLAGFIPEVIITCIKLDFTIVNISSMCTNLI